MGLTRLKVKLLAGAFLLEALGENPFLFVLQTPEAAAFFFLPPGSLPASQQAMAAWVSLALHHSDTLLPPSSTYKDVEPTEIIQDDRTISRSLTQSHQPSPFGYVRECCEFIVLGIRT